MIAWPTATLGFLAAGGSALCTACWQGLLVFGGVALVFRIWPEVPARVQCWVWRVAYVKVLLALLGVGPADLPWLPANTASLGTDIGLITGSTSSWPIVEALSGPTRIAEQFLGGLLLLWLFGVLFVSVRLIRGYQAAQQWLRDCQPLADERLETCLTELCPRFGLTTRPRLYVCEKLTSPALVGVRYPAIFLPLFFVQTCHVAELRLMLAHELAHLKRHDLLWNWLPLLANSLLFFHPLARLAYREWRLAQEAACDELAVRLTAAPLIQYGAVILKATMALPFDFDPLLAAMGAAGSFHTLKRRLLAMKYMHSISRKQLVAAAAVVAILALVALVPWRLTHANPSLSATSPKIEVLDEVNAAAVKIEGKRVTGPSPVILKKVSVNGKEAYAPRVTRESQPGERITVDLGEGKGALQIYTPKDAKPNQQP
jgi:bla regulator protein BlaR1